MLIKGVLFEDFVNYKKPSMTIMMPKCTFKCDIENGCKICQNSHLAHEPNIDVMPLPFLEKYYVPNPITEALVFQGLEPFDSYVDLIAWITSFAQVTDGGSDIVIYTGYNENEITSEGVNINTEVDFLADVAKETGNHLIVKFGRFIPDQEPHFDEVLGVKLASNNQYAKVIV